MLTLTGENVRLRALEPEDLDFILEVENTEKFWEISSIKISLTHHFTGGYFF